MFELAKNVIPDKGRQNSMGDCSGMINSKHVYHTVLIQIKKKAIHL